MLLQPLSNSLIALLLYAGWTLALLVTIATLRTTIVLRDGRRANSFAPTGEDVSPFSARLCRAHANCVENLPIFAAVIAVATLGARADVTDPLALWALAARVAQSGVHLYSVRSRFVLIRFVFMLTQLVILGIWIARLLAPLALH